MAYCEIIQDIWINSRLIMGLFTIIVFILCSYKFGHREGGFNITPACLVSVVIMVIIKVLWLVFFLLINWPCNDELDISVLFRKK